MIVALWGVFGGIALLAGVAAPFVLTGFYLEILTTSLIFAIFAHSLNLILGHGGRPSLGHAVFFGIGAYTVGLMVQHGVHDALLCAFAGIAMSVLAALLIGPLVLRTREVYFLMITLAIGEVLRNLAISWRSVTSGDDGISSIHLGTVAHVDLGNDRNFYFLVFIVLCLVTLLMALITNAPFGHVLRALRDNRSRAIVLGVAPLTVEMSAFAISAALAGTAGVLFAYGKTFVAPDLLSVETSAQVLLMVVVGGAGTLAGPIVGAVIVELIRGLGSLYTERWQIILGVLAVLIALHSRKVLLSSFRSLAAFKSGKRRAAPRAVERGSLATKSALPPNHGPVNTPTVAVPKLRPRPKLDERALLTAHGIVKRFGGLTVLDEISLSLAAGERRGLIGPNGAGKTTFLNILSNIEEPTAGHLEYEGKDITSQPPFRRAQIGIGRTFQIGNLFNESTVRDNILLALLAREGFALRYGRSLSRYTALQQEADELLEKWNLADIAARPVKLLAYGRRRVVEIVLALATRPRLLLLDEPAAGLTSAETKTIIETIGALDPSLSILIVEHDMDLIFSVCDRITVIANGQILAEGDRSEIRRNKQVIDAYLGMPL
jgi:ABC-type branched-subunit amino acid transport system ATPase component/ABC-type branched-subunit amino acid transport system permease subunit